MKPLIPIAAAITLAFWVSSSAAPASPTRDRADCARTSTGLRPLTDLGKRKYRGHPSGLYPSLRNKPAPGYLNKGLAAMRQVRPINGRIVLLSIGMSNTTAEFSALKRLADQDRAKSRAVTIVDGAQDGWDATRLTANETEYFTVVDERLAAASVTASQVQAIWLKEAISGESRQFPQDARALQASLRTIVKMLRTHYPNLRLVYLSSRTYGGYAITRLNPEPAAYDSGYAVRWLIQERMKSKQGGPWLGWGPYLWTDGLRGGRSNGLRWECQDVDEDGTHPSRTGSTKVANMLLTFFKNDATARPWFRARPQR